MSLVLKDVPAFVTVSGNPAGAVGLNVEGMRRRGIADDVVARAARVLPSRVRRGSDGEGSARAHRTTSAASTPEVRLFAASVAQSRWGIIRGRREGNGD